jgi:hypothetical protein
MEMCSVVYQGMTLIIAGGFLYSVLKIGDPLRQKSRSLPTSNRAEEFPTPAVRANVLPKISQMKIKQKLP